MIKRWQKKERKRMIAKNLIWNTGVVLAYNGIGLTEGFKK